MTLMTTSSYTDVTGNYNETTYPPSLLFDGSHAALVNSSGTNNATDDLYYANFTLATPAKIYSAAIWDAENSNYNYTGTCTIRGSHNGSTWTTLITIAASGTNATWKSVRFPTSGYTASTDQTTVWEYVSVYCDGNTRGAYGRLSEAIINLNNEGWSTISRINGVSSSTMSRVNGIAIGGIARVNGVAV